MLQKLLHSCALLWLLGIVGMWSARVLLASELAEPPFRMAAGCWILGGIGYTCFALVSLVERSGAHRR